MRAQVFCDCGGEVVGGLAGRVELDEQGQELLSHGAFDCRGLAGPGCAEEGVQLPGVCVDVAAAAGPFETCAQLAESQSRGLVRSGCHRQHFSGVGPGQAAFSGVEGIQGSGIVLAQQRADLVGDLLSVPDGVLLGPGQDGDGSRFVAVCG